MDAVGLDVYGTLVDPLSMQDHLRGAAGDRAPEVAALWRTKQVEYAFRRGLMQTWTTFETCTAQALAYAARAAGIALADAERDALLARYRQLPPYPEVRDALAGLRRGGRTVVAFSNGSGPVVRELLAHAGVLELLDDVVSVDEVRTFKPHPSVYRRLAERVGKAPGETWLVSANAWDVIGAKAAGLRAAWVRRSPGSLFDPWEIEPDAVVAELGELAGALPR
jgi:2-haloacid dehalogenase